MLRSPEARAYLERLEDLLPERDARRVCAEVESLILDRAEAEAQRGTPSDPLDLERRALTHLGTPEALADTLVNAPLTVSLSVRRAFTRWLLVLIAGHLLLSILLTVGRSEGAAIPGLLFPLPRSPWWATLTSALGIVLLDAGLLLALFGLLARRTAPGRLPSLSLAPAWGRPEAWRTLVLVLLLALLAHPLRDRVFAVRRGDGFQPFLAPDIVSLLPWLNVVLGLVALRCLFVLAGRDHTPRASVLPLVADALAGLAAIGLLVAASTRSEVVRLPADTLGADTAHVLNDLITRAFLVVFVGAALLLAVRVVKRCVRIKRVFASG